MSESDSGRESPQVDYRPKPTYHHPKQIDDDKNTELHYASAKNDVEAVVDYLENKSRIVDPENYLGWTPLMMACRQGHLETVKVLLSYRANATKKNRMGMNVFQISIASGNLELVEYLLDHFLTGGISKRVLESNFSTVSIAALFRHQNILEFLIKKHFQTNMQTTISGVTPLMFAQAVGNDSAIATLLKNKVDTKIKNFLGHTAADIATIRQQLKFIDTNDHRFLGQKPPPPASREQDPTAELQNQTELQNQQLRAILQLNKPSNSPSVLQPAVYSPSQVPYIVLSPYPNSSFTHTPMSYLQVPGQMVPVSTRKSSNISPFPVPPPPNVTPITPLTNVHGQVFFPPTFSPSQPPITMSTHMYDVMMSQSHNAGELLNAKINSSAGLFLSPPVMTFMSPCM